MHRLLEYASEPSAILSTAKTHAPVARSSSGLRLSNLKGKVGLVTGPLSDALKW